MIKTVEIKGVKVKVGMPFLHLQICGFCFCKSDSELVVFDFTLLLIYTILYNNKILILIKY